MAHAHHPHLLTHEWFDLHPALAAAFRNHHGALVAAVLIGLAGLFVTNLDRAHDVPMRLGSTIHAGGGLSTDVQAKQVPAGSMSDQFYSQKAAAPIEPLPDQF